MDIYTISKAADRFRVDKTTDPPSSRWMTWHRTLKDAKESIPSICAFTNERFKVPEDIWIESWLVFETIEDKKKWIKNGF